MDHRLGISKNFTVHQNKDIRQYWSLKQLTIYNVITSHNLICLMVYILKLRAQHLMVWNNALPQIKKPPHNRWLSLSIGSFYTS
jgi:hypothetical protein